VTTPGLELARAFHDDVVRPVLESRFPGLVYAAALLGSGSEVLGYDDDTSTDHDWGPRITLFVDAPHDELARELPAGVEIATLRAYLDRALGFDPLRPIAARDWLVTPQQILLSLTAGAVLHDGSGELTAARRNLAWYPHDVWLYAMLGHWRRIAQLEPFVGRTGSTGDDLGSRTIAALLVRDLMRLALAQERRYAPYPKWLGRAYAELGRPERPLLEQALRAEAWRERERALAEAARLAADAHDRLGVTERVGAEPHRFHERPFVVIGADRVCDALRAAGATAVEHLAGAVDAVTDNTDVLSRDLLWRRLASLYYY
jgi:hypothetical protein